MSKKEIIKRKDKIRSGQKINPDKKSALPRGKGKAKTIFLYVALILFATWISYTPALKNDFTNWDDQEYITNNTELQDLSKQSISKTFSSYKMGNYHPLTMLSYALEYKYFQLNPKAFHTTNLIIHLLNTLLVFLFIYLLVEKASIAFIVSLLFGIHPMHVESVAWVSERKDVLYSFFYLAALIVYLRYSVKKSLLLYLVVSFLFLCSLLSKGVAVTLPVILLLIDYYQGKKISFKLVAEKIPFFILSLIFGVIAIYAQESAKAIGDIKTYTVFERFLFVNYSIAAYVWKSIVPLNLSTFYDYPLKQNGYYPLLFYIVPVLNIGLAIVAYRLMRWHKVIFFGISFFIVTIFLVLQLLPVGGAIIADRYTYIPYLGLFFMLAYGLVWLWEQRSNKFRIPVIGLSILIAFMYAYISFERCKVWKDSITLWNDVISKNNKSPKAFNNRGDAYNIAKQYELAIKDLDRSLALKYDYPDAYYNRGLSYYYLGKHEEAIRDYNLAIQYNPDLAVAYFNRSGTYYYQKKYEAALQDALKAESLGKEVDPKYIEALKEGVRISKANNQ